MPQITPLIGHLDQEQPLLPLSLPQRVGEGRSIAGTASRDAKGAGEFEKIGIVQVRVTIAFLVFEALLMLDSAVGVIVVDNYDNAQSIARCRRQLLARHQKAAIAGETDDDAVG